MERLRDGGKRPETAAQISEAVQQQVARPKSAQAAVPSQDLGEWEEMKSSAGTHPSSYIRTLNSAVRWMSCSAARRTLASTTGKTGAQRKLAAV